MRFIPCERVGLPDMQKARAFCAGFLALCYPVVQPFEQRNPPGLTPIQPRGPAAKTKNRIWLPIHGLQNGVVPLYACSRNVSTFDTKLLVENKICPAIISRIEIS